MGWSTCGHSHSTKPAPTRLLRHYHLFDATLAEFYRRAGWLANRPGRNEIARELIDRRLLVNDLFLQLLRETS